jgi:hypothetical protein
LGSQFTSGTANFQKCPVLPSTGSQQRLRLEAEKDLKIWRAWERFCADVGVDADKAFSMGWSEALEHFR